MVSQRGYTLIEIMVTMAILVIVITQAAQFGKNWIDQAKVNEAQSALLSAFDIAKNTAISNNSGNTIGSILVITPGYICIKYATNYSASCVNNYIYQKDVSANILLNLKGNNCVAFDNTGIPVSNGTCDTQLSYSVTQGGQNAQGKLI